MLTKLAPIRQYNTIGRQHSNNSITKPDLLPNAYPNIASAHNPTRNQFHPKPNLCSSANIWINSNVRASQRSMVLNRLTKSYACLNKQILLTRFAACYQQLRIKLAASKFNKMCKPSRLETSTQRWSAANTPQACNRPAAR